MKIEASCIHLLKKISNIQIDILNIFIKTIIETKNVLYVINRKRLKGDALHF